LRTIYPAEGKGKGRGGKLNSYRVLIFRKTGGSGAIRCAGRERRKARLSETYIIRGGKGVELSLPIDAEVRSSSWRTEAAPNAPGKNVEVTIFFIMIIEEERR